MLRLREVKPCGPRSADLLNHAAAGETFNLTNWFLFPLLFFILSCGTYSQNGGDVTVSSFQDWLCTVYSEGGGEAENQDLMVSPPPAESNCALIISTFNCTIEEDWAVWTLTVDLPVCVLAELNIPPSCRVPRRLWQVIWWSGVNLQRLPVSHDNMNSPFFSRPLHPSGSTKFSGWCLFTFCPCRCVLAKWRRTGLSPSRGQHCSAPQEVMDNAGMCTPQCVCVCVCAWTETRTYMCVNNLCMHTCTQDRPPFLHNYLFAVIHSDYTVQEAGCSTSHRHRPMSLSHTGIRSLWRYSGLHVA